MKDDIAIAISNRLEEIMKKIYILESISDVICSDSDIFECSCCKMQGDRKRHERCAGSILESFIHEYEKRL